MFDLVSFSNIMPPRNAIAISKNGKRANANGSVCFVPFFDFFFFLMGYILTIRMFYPFTLNFLFI